MAENENLKREKFRRAHGKPCRIALPDGKTVTIDRFEMIRTYLGLIDGIPRKPYVDKRISEALDYVNEHWKRPRTIVVPPEILDPDSKSPVLPTLTMMAQLSSLDSYKKGEHGSWLNIVWFADIDNQKTITEFVAAAMQHVDWEEEAESFLF